MFRKAFCLLAVLLLLPTFVSPAHAAPDISTFSVFGTNSVWIRQGATVSSGNIGVLDASSGPWLDSQSEVTIGKSVYLPDGVTIYGDTVKVKTGASVFDVHYNGLTNNGTVRGTEYSPLTLPLDVTLPPFPTPAPGTVNHVIPIGGSLILDPGSYGEITVKKNATLTLTGGTYHFKNLDLGDAGGSRVLFQAPTDVIINNRLGPGQNAVIGPDTGSGISAKDIRIYVNGINGSTGNLGATPKAARIGYNNTLQANIYAPNGTLLIKQGTVAEGAYIGKDVQVGLSVQVTLNYGFTQPEPTASIWASDQRIQLGESTTLSWNSTYADTVSIDHGIGSVDPEDSLDVFPTETTTYTITATGPGGTATDNVTVTVYIPLPTVEISADPESIVYGNPSTLSWSSTHADTASIDQEIGSVDTTGTTTVSPERTTTYTITVTGPGGTADAQVVVTVTADVTPPPPGSFGETYQDQIPPDATIETYDSYRFSLITGLVQDVDGLPVGEVSITILDHPEYGTALTDSEGRFTIPVEGGATNTVVYQKEGLITAHRKVDVPWNDTAVAETMKMLAEDPVATTVTFDGSPNTVITHESTQVTDASGTRSCTMVFTGDNHAYEVDAQGNVIQELTSITTRATEFTTPESMPAILPPTSAYTYCVDQSVDGVERVKFDKPVINWVDNFLGFAVGTVVPVGTYNRDRGEWVPEEDGVVVALLDTDTDGIVDALDSDGDGLANDLDNDGSLSDEVLGLGDPGRYAPGATFWRVATTHFTPADYNFAFGYPTGASRPNPEAPPYIAQQCDGDCQSPKISSFVEERSRIFHEDIPIPGTDLTLHYASNRVSGFQTRITVPASGDTVSSVLKRIIVRVEVAGRTLEQTLDALPNQKAEFVWDGLDHLGRQVRGPTTAHIGVGFVYDVVYYTVGSDAFTRSFAQAGGDATTITARQEIISWKQSEMIIHRGGRRGDIGEGWTLSPHHHLSPMYPSTLYKGDGTTSRYHANIIETAAGTGECCYNGDDIPATEAKVHTPAGAAVDAEGNLYIAEWGSARVRKVDTNGIITTVAGGGNPPDGVGDGGPATAAKFGQPRDVAVDGAGNLYIADQWNQRVRKVDTNGIITTVAGGGNPPDGLGDGGPATEARVIGPTGVAVDASRNLYIAQGGRRVRKVDPSGIITTVAGTGNWNPANRNDGGPATEADLDVPIGVAVDAAGNLYISDYKNHSIRKVDPSGIITTFAGRGNPADGIGDGGPATEARLKYPWGVEVNAEGNLYIADSNHGSIRKVDTEGIITTIAGTGTQGPSSGDGGPATEAYLNTPAGVAVDAVGNVYIADYYGLLVRKVNRPSAFSSYIITDEVPFAEENGLLHILNSAGRHLRTTDLDTGIVLYEFGYDAGDNLVSITDRFGNQTLINRDGSGVPLSITSPDGITTSLTIDGNNHLTGVAYPGGELYTLEYAADGLLTAKVEPEGNRFEHVFDSVGRLTDATDQEGGHWTYTRSTSANGDILTEIVTGEGSLTSYLDNTDSTGAYTSTITDPTGAQTLFSQSADGLTVNKSLPCGMELAFEYGTDSEYKFQVVKKMTESTPTGLDKVTLRDKTYQDTNSDDVPDRITETVTVNGKATSLVTNTLQAQKTITSPAGRTVTTAYDPTTLLSTSLTIPGLHATAYGYDTKGRLTSITTNARQTSFVYNAQGNLESITDPENQATTYSYDAVGRMTGISRPDTSSVGFTYDKNGNMTVLTNPSTITHDFGYNTVNLNSSYDTPLSGSYSYVYDKDRRLTQVNFPSGKQINNFYTNGRLEQIQTPEGNVDLTYLCGTKVDSITKGTESLGYDYDGSLVTAESLTGTLNQSLTYGYNSDFNLTSFTYGGGSVSYSYDNDGLLTGAGSYTIARDAGNGLPDSVNGGALSLSRTFNGYGEVEGQDFTVGTASATSWSLTRDNAGRITNKTETVDGVPSNYVYTYDPMGRLRTVTKDANLVEEYQYDSVGTRTYEMNSQRGIAGRTLTCDEEDHLLTAGSDVYQYDVDGYLQRKEVGTDETTYRYSSRGELLTVTLPDTTPIEYVHDPLGRRIAKKINGAITEKYLWQGLTRLLAVYDGSDSLVMRFLYADGRMPVAMESGGATYYLTYDQVGSLRVVTDSAGTVVKRIDYDSFGNIINDTNASFEIPLGFAGGLHDRDTELVRFGFRDYDPDVGRWTAKDPIRFWGGDIDLYGYCLNDPLNWIDPSGLVLWYADKKAEATFKPHIKTLMRSPAGRRLLKRLHGDPQIYRIHELPCGTSDAYQARGNIYIDPCFHPIIETTKGLKAASTPRILAHELGHLTGARDDGPGRMNNVNAYENPIMRPTERYDRTVY